MADINIEVGDKCPVKDCEGIIDTEQDNCYCSATSMPPCSACECSWLECPECGTEFD